MAKFAFAIPKETYKIMKKYPKTDWNAVALKAIEDKAEEVEEDDAWRRYAIKHALETGWSEAEELFVIPKEKTKESPKKSSKK